MHGKTNGLSWGPSRRKYRFLGVRSATSTDSCRRLQCVLALCTLLCELRARRLAAMTTTAFTASGTTSVVLALGRASWRIGVALSNLDEDTEIVNFNVKDLSGEVKTLGIECDALYTRLEELNGGTGRSLISGVDDGLWNCLATQVDEACRTVHELELFVRIVRGEETRFIGQAQRLRKLDKSKGKIAETSIRVVRHTNNFRLTRLLVDT